MSLYIDPYIGFLRDDTTGKLIGYVDDRGAQFTLDGVPIPAGSTPSGPIAGGTGAWGGITGTLSAQADLQTALNAKAAYNAPVTLTASTVLTAAAHANRLLIVNSATDVTLTLQSDAAGGFAGDDAIFVYRQGVGQATILAGTATLENTTSMLVATAANRAFISAQRVRASVWAPQEPAAGGATTQTIVDHGAGAVAGTSAVNVTIASLTIAANTFLAGKRLALEFLMQVLPGASSTFEVLYGGSVIASGQFNNTFGATGKIIGRVTVWATADNAQHSSGGIGAGAWYHNYSQLSIAGSPPALTSAVDATASQTLLIRCSTGAEAGITIQVLRAKVIIE